MSDTALLSGAIPAAREPAEPNRHGNRHANGLRAAIREALADLAEIQPYEVSPELYRDWNAGEEFEVAVGRGECAS